jgi:hypothetical protein
MIAVAFWFDLAIQGGPKVRDKVIQFLDDNVNNHP